MTGIAATCAHSSHSSDAVARLATRLPAACGPCGSTAPRCRAASRRPRSLTAGQIRAQRQSLQRPTIGKCVKAGSKPAASRTARRIACSAGEGSGVERPQRLAGRPAARCGRSARSARDRARGGRGGRSRSPRASRGCGRSTRGRRRRRSPPRSAAARRRAAPRAPTGVRVEIRMPCARTVLRRVGRLIVTCPLAHRDRSVWITAARARTRCACHGIAVEAVRERDPQLPATLARGRRRAPRARRARARADRASRAAAPAAPSGSRPRRRRCGSAPSRARRRRARSAPRPSRAGRASTARRGPVVGLEDRELDVDVDARRAQQLLLGVDEREVAPRRVGPAGGELRLAERDHVLGQRQPCRRPGAAARDRRAVEPSSRASPASARRDSPGTSAARARTPGARRGAVAAAALQLARAARARRRCSPARGRRRRRRGASPPPRRPGRRAARAGTRRGRRPARFGLRSTIACSSRSASS